MQLPAQLLKRNPNTHKGDYGHVGIVGGSWGMAGAVCLAARAALRTGAGKVTIAVPRSIVPIVQGCVNEAMAVSLPETGQGTIASGALKFLRNSVQAFDVLAIGMGASRHPQTAGFLRKIGVKDDQVLLIDADALNAFEGRAGEIPRGRRQMICTPHIQEFSRLSGYTVEQIMDDRKKLAKEYALQYNLILVLKGPGTVVTDGHTLFENTTGNPGMATAGSGDVLSGIIVGLCAQKIPSYEAACLGVYLHGLAGDIAVEEKTQVSLIASDIIEYIPDALKKMHTEDKSSC